MSLRPSVIRHVNPANVVPAKQLLELFLQHNQTNETPPPEDSSEWAALTTHGALAFEHARWLTTDLLQQVLDAELFKSPVQNSDLYGRSDLEQARILLSRRGQYIALTQEDGRFDKLIDRRLLLEDMVQGILRESSKQGAAPT